MSSIDLDVGDELKIKNRTAYLVAKYSFFILVQFPNYKETFYYDEIRHFTIIKKPKEVKKYYDELQQMEQLQC